MTPQERQLIDDLFGRLEKLEANPREPEAEAVIAQGLRRAPHAVYALVQTVLLQDEALRHATARIEQLEAGQHPEKEGSFLDSLRDTLFGGAPASQGYAQGTSQGSGQGSVPNVPPGAARPSWNTGQVLGGGEPGRRDAFPDPRAAQGYGAPQSGAGGGSSFLGTAAAAAAGMIGGSLLMNSLRGLGGGGQQQSFGNTGSPSTGSPWSGGGNDALARDAGINDIGKSQHGGVEDRRNEHAAYDDASSDDEDGDYDDDGDFDDGDFGSDPSDFA